jgi:pyruvate dehydrogenase E2 component (dihydrolipoamide acetyltransferase)
MIEQLNLIVSESADGKHKVHYIGTDRTKAIEVFENRSGDESLVELAHLREPRPERTIRPAYVAQVAAEEKAEAEAEVAAAQAAADAAAETAARANASLAAIELADIKGISLRGIAGTGPGGQIITADLADLPPVDPPEDK